MTSGEPDFLNIGWMKSLTGILCLPGSLILIKPLATLLLAYLTLTPLEAKCYFLGSRAVEKVGFKANSMLIKCQGLAKVLHMSIEGRKGKALGDHANGTHGVPVESP